MELIKRIINTLEKIKIEYLIEKYGKEYRIPQHIIKAIIKVESNFNSDAMRYEPDYKWLKLPLDKYHYNEATEEVSQKTSWGLMQVMGAVAREKGFEGNYLSKLLKPQIGIKYGCKHLYSYYKKYNSWEDAISSYNQGSPRTNDEGEYENQEYVDKVLHYADQYKKKG